MLARQVDPCDVYRRVELDARVEGTDGIGLTRLCLDRALTEIERSGRAHQRSDRATLVDALTRAASSVAGLSSGIEDGNLLREALVHLYSSAETALRASIIDYRPDVLKRVETDLRDILALL